MPPRTFRGLFRVGRVGRLGEEELHPLHGPAGGVVLHFLRRKEKEGREGGKKGWRVRWNKRNLDLDGEKESFCSSLPPTFPPSLPQRSAPEPAAKRHTPPLLLSPLAVSAHPLLQKAGRRAGVRTGGRAGRPGAWRGRDRGGRRGGDGRKAPVGGKQR